MWGVNPKRPSWTGAALSRTTKVQVVPSPVGGINAVSPYVATEPSYCLVATNLNATGQGMRVRSGHTVFAENIGTDGIRTVIPFEGSTESKLFAVASDGIFDVSAGGAGPWSAAVTFGTSSSNSGWGSWTNFVADAGNHYVFYADEENGLYRYVEGGSWAAVTDITGVTEADLHFVTQHQSRVWFAEAASATGWYLAAGTISGAATPFYFGNKFKHGGILKGLYTWTVDGGEGLDDHLVAISSGGDVMVYKGIDPSQASSWELVGQFYVGQLPAGRRVAQTEGGDLYILSQYGVIPLTRLMQGQLVQQEGAQLSRNISPLIAQAMSLTINSRGWEMKNIPSENVFIVARPALTGQAELQFTLSSHTNGWTTWEDLPYQTGDVWEGTFYFGDPDGNLYILDGNTDDEEAITFSLLTSFQEYGETGQYHRVHFMRPVFRAAGAPSFALLPRYDYNTDPPIAPSAVPVVTGPLWDIALWDSAYWTSDGVVVQPVTAGTGIGRAMAIAMIGTSSFETLFIRCDLMFDTGSIL